MTAASHAQEMRRSVLALLATGIAALVLGLEAAPVLRAVIVAPYLLFVPGYMLVRLVGPGMGWFAYPAAVAVSASLFAALGVVLVYSGAWAPPMAMALMMVITIFAAGLTVARRRVLGNGFGNGGQDG